MSTKRGGVRPRLRVTTALLAAAVSLLGGGAARAATLEWNTFLGGAGGNEVAAGIARDAAGNIYVVGVATAGFGIPTRPYTASSDAFVAKLSPNGTRLWLTFLGGSGQDFGEAVAVNAAGNVYVAGYSNATWGAPLVAYSQSTDGFVARLDASTGTLVWQTFVGGSGGDRNDAVATLGTAVLVAGSSGATWGTPVRPYSALSDAHVMALNAATGARLWHTFLGGSGDDFGYGLGSEGADSLFIVGDADATWGMPVRPYTLEVDGFAARLDADTGALVWSSFLGGSGFDVARGVAVDGAGQVYVAGSASASWGNPVTAFATAAMNSFDAFVARLSGSSGALIWNTFLGSPASDLGHGGIATDALGNVYVAGESQASWGTPLAAYTASNDGFVASLTTAGGARNWNTFVGGTGVDGAYALTADAQGNLFATGPSTASWGSPIVAYTGFSDAFAVRLRSDFVFRDGFED